MAESGNNEPSTVEQRDKFDVRITWDGDQRTYHVIRRTIKAYLIMNDMDYMIDPTFVKAYTESGWEVAGTQVPSISTAQFQHDQKKLYGIWLQTTRSVSSLQRFFLPYTVDADGVKLTDSIHQEFNQNRGILSAISDADAVLEQPYHDQLGVVEFVKNLVEAIAVRNNIIHQHKDEDHGFVPTSDFQAIYLIRTKLQTADPSTASLIYDLCKSAVTVAPSEDAEPAIEFNFDGTVDIHYCNKAVHPDTGKLAEYRELMHSSEGAQWQQSCAEVCVGFLFALSLIHRLSGDRLSAELLCVSLPIHTNAGKVAINSCSNCRYCNIHAIQLDEVY